MLLAVMDLGSNSFKMTVAQWAPELSRRRPFQVLHKERYPIQLGASVFSEGAISKGDFKKAVQALKKMQARLRDFTSPILRVVATSAIRDSRNGAQFVEYVRRELGLNIEVISGRQEASLIAAGLNIEYPKVSRGLLVDIGGGSTEIASFGTEITKASFCRSYRIGSVRVATRFFAKGQKLDLVKARRSVREAFISLQPANVEKVVGSAGTIQSLAKIFYPNSKQPIIQLSRLSRWIEENFDRSPRQLEKKYMLRPSRARVLVPGAIVLEEILTTLQKNSIVVTGMTLRDGLMVDLVENWVKPREVVLPAHLSAGLRGNGLNKLFLNELETLASRFMVSSTTAHHIAYLSNTLFLQFKKHLHRKHTAEDLRCLTAAAFFYYCGRSISEKDFEKHSAYIVENVSLRHLSQRERKIVSRILMFAKSKSLPAKGVSLWGFKPAETQKIFRMIAVFRLAVSLDEIESRNIVSAKISLRGQQALIRLVQKGPGKVLNPLSVKSQFAYFEQVFGLKVVTFVEHAPPTLKT